MCSKIRNRTRGWGIIGVFIQKLDMSLLYLVQRFVVGVLDEMVGQVAGIGGLWGWLEVVQEAWQFE